MRNSGPPGLRFFYYLSRFVKIKNSRLCSAKMFIPSEGVL